MITVDDNSVTSINKALISNFEELKNLIDELKKLVESLRK